MSLGIARFFAVGQAKEIAHVTAEITPEPMLKLRTQGIGHTVSHNTTEIAC
jgi:hypothetical protein